MDSATANDIATRCVTIINHPERNVGDIGMLLKKYKSEEVIFPSLAKVFRNIAPLYRIRVHSEKVKHRSGDLDISTFDTQLVNHYNNYIKELCALKSSMSYVCACDLLSTLDHFNFADRLVAKVLTGSNMNSELGDKCVDTLVDRIKNDATGETVFMIMNQCLDYRHSERVVEALLESKYLEKCVATRIDKEEKYNREYQERKKAELRPKLKRGFFGKTPIFGKPAKELEKQRRIQELSAKKAEDESAAPLDDKNYVRTANALQRLYFTILKEKMAPCYSSVFIGVRKYIKLIRQEFREGLYVLLADAIVEAGLDAAIEGVDTVIFAYGSTGLDFKRIIDRIYGLLDPFNADFNEQNMARLGELLKSMFVTIKQPVHRAVAFSQRLMRFAVVRRMPCIAGIVRMLEVTYDLDFTDAESKNKRLHEMQTEEVDKVANKPFYEYFLFKRMC